MDWNNKPAGSRSALGLALLILGALVLVAAVALTLTLGTVWALILLGASVALNTAAVMLLRRKK